MKFKLTAPLTATFLLASFGGFAQRLEQPISEHLSLRSVEPGDLNPIASAAPQEPGQASSPASDTDPSTAMDDQWHIAFDPYLWFPGVHGKTGAFGRNASVHASAGDLLSHFDIGLMGTVEARKNRFVMPIDTVWTVISDDKGLPENQPGIESISVRGGLFIFTPKAGYRVIDASKVKVDGLIGLRYWHLGERFHFNPTLYKEAHISQNWVDVVAGAQIKMLLSPKAAILVLGDAGGGQASPDYEAAGLLGLKLKKNLDLFMGWRYLDVHYRNNNKLFLYDMAESGAVLGASFYFK